MRSSALEDAMAWQIRAGKLPHPEREYRPVEGRRWRMDFAWPELMIALEVEGGTWVQGRHSRPQGFERDCEKYNALAIDGWLVLRVTGDMVQDGRALNLLECAIDRREAA